MSFDGVAVTVNEADYLKLPFAWSVTVNDRPMAALNHSVLGSTAASSPR